MPKNTETLCCLILASLFTVACSPEDPKVVADSGIDARIDGALSDAARESSVGDAAVDAEEPDDGAVGIAHTFLIQSFHIPTNAERDANNLAGLNLDGLDSDGSNTRCDNRLDGIGQWGMGIDNQLGPMLNTLSGTLNNDLQIALNRVSFGMTLEIPSSANPRRVLIRTIPVSFRSAIQINGQGRPAANQDVYRGEVVAMVDTARIRDNLLSFEVAELPLSFPITNGTLSIKLKQAQVRAYIEADGTIVRGAVGGVITREDMLQAVRNTMPQFESAVAVLFDGRADFFPVTAAAENCGAASFGLSFTAAPASLVDEPNPDAGADAGIDAGDAN